ncbi:hypothetical protein MTR67_024114 [Solanum verrucosum]|uniref:Uncharacterized protein n=1 Tax=Solanum verrucosum TaxID=315347 RepID=A0AAF0TSR1_SOLVR|nr:hypothetical protein MTR67_024114 [Solanum verrucosum]
MNHLISQPQTIQLKMSLVK